MNAWITRLSQTLKGNPPATIASPAPDIDTLVTPSAGDLPGSSSEHLAGTNQVPSAEVVASDDTNAIAPELMIGLLISTPGAEVGGSGSKSAEVKVVEGNSRSKKRKHKHKHRNKSSGKSSKRNKSRSERRAHREAADQAEEEEENTKNLKE
ncbi:hypothetical protein Salat_2785500 [Sesamum alatum]|uniref:Uncharacterized protein n=1 Tax=Sesamum alatum TaxID=300844 RepID=A0AAE1XLS3_9LAMI|nr:hypothetical protein Salat_2785500 [Sesamum alatum]